MTPPPHVQNVIDRLRKVKKSAKGWTARCPAHDDSTPSLSIGIGEDGRVLLKCHAGCSNAAIVQAIGLKMRDLFPRSDAAAAGAPGKPCAEPYAPHTAPTRRPAEPLSAPDAATPPRPPRRPQSTPDGDAPPRIVTTYAYADGNGKLLYEVVRFEPKDFRQRRPDGRGGWIWNLDGTPRVPYHLPELLASDPTAWVLVCEGEKDVDSVRGLDLAATCNPGGAGKWKYLTDDSALHDRRVAIIPDRDEPGRKHAQDVATRLHGKAADVRIIDLGAIGGFAGKDVCDWLDSLDSKEPRDLARALEDMAEAAPTWTLGDDDDSTTEPAYAPVMRCMADVKPERVRWLWPSRIALGKLTVIAGDPGLGKSFLTLDMAARVTTGTPWPDRPEDGQANGGGVVLLTAEDDLADTVRPRLDAAGAVARRINALEAVRDSDGDGNPKQRAFNLAQDLEALESAIARVTGCRLVIIDPISAYVGKTDSYKNTDVRALLAPLGELAARRGVAVVAVTHLRKGEGAAIYRAMGSLAFVAAARAVYVVSRDPEDASGNRRFFLPTKNNLGNDRDGLAYCLVPDGDTARVAWERDPVTESVDDVLSASAGSVKRPGPDPAERNVAVEWLRDRLTDGPQPVGELLRAAAREICVSKSTLRRARDALGVSTEKTAFKGHWAWALPDADGEDANSPTHKEPGTLGGPETFDGNDTEQTDF